MDQLHRLNVDEIADALSGKSAEERIADCPSCAAEFADWTELGGKLRQDLASRSDLPVYFWALQRARICERLAPRTASLGWVTAAICALVLLAFGLIRQDVAPRTEVAHAKPAISASPVAQVDPDDDLLQDIHASLERELPAPLAPAAVLVEEMASNQAQQVKEN